MSDPFAHLLDTEFDATPAAPASKPMPSVAKGEAGAGFVEVCPKCRGTGRFRAWGTCFACQGKGKNTFATSPEARAKSRDRAVAKRVEKAQSIADQAAAWIAAHPAEAKWLADAGRRNIERGGTFTFPQDLLGKLHQWGTLTDGQLGAVRKLMARDEERSAARVAAAPTVDATKLEKAFTIAHEKAKRPGAMGVFTKPLKLTSPDKVTLAFRPGSEGSQWADMLFVKSNDGRKLGHIKGGKFFRKFDCTPVEEAAVLACASDPETAVVAFAKAWSACGVCGQRLLNDVSIARGIGPICASKFGW